MRNLLLILLVCLFPVSSFANSGADPYTPTKQQWLALWLNSAAAMFKDEGITVSILPDAQDPNTIVILGMFWPNKTSKSDVDYVLKHFLEKNKATFSGPGWEWIKFKVEPLALKTSPKKAH